MAEVEKIVIDKKELDEIKYKNRDLIISVKEKSEDNFEKNLVLIISGTLVLSLTYIEKIAPLKSAQGIPWLISSWIVLTICLLINLISHQITSSYSQKYIEQLDSGVDADDINIIMKKDNGLLNKINYWTIAFLISGIALLVVYCSINALQMSKLQNIDQEIKIPKPDQDLITKGRTSTPLVVSKPQTTQAKPAGTSSGGTKK